MRIDTEDLNEPLMTTCIIMSLPITDLVLMCVNAGSFHQRSEGTRQCGGLALQAGGGDVLLTTTPQQGGHRRLPGEVKRGVGGGWTSITGNHKDLHRRDQCSSDFLNISPVCFCLFCVTHFGFAKMARCHHQVFFIFIQGFNFSLCVGPPGGADHLSDDVVQGHGSLPGGRPRSLCCPAGI